MDKSKLVHIRAIRFASCSRISVTFVFEVADVSIACNYIFTHEFLSYMVINNIIHVSAYFVQMSQRTCPAWQRTRMATWIYWTVGVA